MKLSGNVENGPRNTGMHFGEVPHFWRDFDLGSTKDPRSKVFDYEAADFVM